MDSYLTNHPRDDIWRLQHDMKAVLATQIDHSDRLLRLERRQDEDFRLKSVWGTSSPFPEPNFNPAAEAFRSFDQDQAASTMGSLHLDTEEEPRRGASRANSVRFDESALHGHFAHGSRSSSDFFPTRTGSGLGSHPMTERSSSYKSEGRQSSNGQSTRLNSLRIDTCPSSPSHGNPLGPPPGFFLLGSLPSIIRCWLDTNFSNETLVYAAICTGSCHSFLQGKLASRLKPNDSNELQSSSGKLRLNVFLPEAVFQHSSSRPSSPASQLPMITVDFTVYEYPYLDDSIQVVIGSDVLRLRNADILLSQDRLTLFDDRRNKVIVPLVRPENPNIYQHLITLPSLAPSGSPTIGLRDDSLKPSTNHETPEGVEIQLLRHSDQAIGKGSLLSLTIEGSPKKYVPPSRFQKLAFDEGHGTQESESTGKQALTTPVPNGVMQELGPSSDGSGPNLPATTESAGICGPWRRDLESSSRQNLSCSDALIPSTHQRSGRGRCMKVLKPSRPSTSHRSNQNSNVTSSEVSADQPENTNNRSSQTQSIETSMASFSRKSLSSGSKSPIQGNNNRSRPANPVGGASAFAWLNSDQRFERKMSTGILTKTLASDGIH